jgi:hypothetical protein
VVVLCKPVVASGHQLDDDLLASDRPPGAVLQLGVDVRYHLQTQGAGLLLYATSHTFVPHLQFETGSRNASSQQCRANRHLLSCGLLLIVVVANLAAVLAARIVPLPVKRTCEMTSARHGYMTTCKRRLTQNTQVSHRFFVVGSVRSKKSSNRRSKFVSFGSK